MTGGETVHSLMAALIEAVAAVLGLERHRVDPGENLSAYGFDSITLTQLANRLNRAFPFVSLEAATFLEYTTLEALGTHLHARYREEFEAFLGTAPVASPPPQAQLETARAEKPADAAPAAPDISGSGLLEAFDFEDEAEPCEPFRPESASGAGAVAGNGGDIAVIGFAGRFPGAEDILALWENLVLERSALVEVPEDRWDWRAIYGDPEAGGNRTDCRYGGFLEGLDRFDPEFFGISPLEAREMDPQQKLVLRAAWETLENAGYAVDRLRGEKVGVYLGVQRNENLLKLMKAGGDFGPYTNIGNTHSMLANRVSWFFDWKGDSLSVDTACAASSSALHLACHALRRGEIRLALVGGVTAVQDPFSHIANRRMGLLTKEPKVCPFDRDSGGYLIGEGVATALLKPLAEAERDGDYIYGVIKGCAVGQGGRSVFLTAPDPKSHAEVIRSALREAGLEPGDIDYLEGQGTGTELSDKAELKAYAEVFRGGETGRPLPDRKLGLGSIKGNIGHVESASGITALIKVCLAMKGGLIPPVLNFRALNWTGSEEDLPFRVVGRALAWERRAGVDGVPVPRRAGVHNFGYGGLCAHFIVEEYMAPSEREASHGGGTGEELLVFSSRSGPQLDRYLARFLHYLQGGQYRHFGLKRPNLRDLAHTLRCGRQEMAVRLAVVASSVEDLAARIRLYLEGERRVPGLFAGTAEGAEPLPAALYEARAFSEIAARWVRGGSFAGLGGPARLDTEAQARSDMAVRGRRIPLPNFCFASGTNADSEPAFGDTAPGLDAVAWRRFSGAFRTLEEISRELLLDRFQALGLCRTPGEVLEPESLKARLGIAPQHHRLFALLPEILARAGILEREHGRYRVIGAPRVDSAALDLKRGELLQAFPELETQIDLSSDCIARLWEILTGKLPATALLFPEGSMRRVEGFYRGNPVADHFNALVNWQGLAAVRELGRERGPGETIRILEIGAGTGGTTEGLLKTLGCFGDRLSYVYSDVSPAFTQHGKGKFGARFPFVEFRVLDIEKDIAAQGFEAQAFDLIVASNVLHATADLRRTVGNVRRLLKPGGRLILNEVTHAQDFIALTFGLLPGWWAFRDGGRRLPDGPLLNSEMWAALLREQGFLSVEIHGQTGPDGGDTGHNVVVASDRVPAAAARPAAAIRDRTAPPDTAAGANPDLVRKVREVFAKVLMTAADRIDADAPFVDFGVDSFTSVQVGRALGEAFGVRLRGTELFNFPNIRALSRHLRDLTAHAGAELPAAARRNAAVPPVSARPAAAVSPEAGAGGRAPIAVIGLSGRFPGASDIGEFWRNLAEGRDSVGAVPPERWESREFRGGFLAGVDRFDPLFFGISPREAEWMDPQARLFLQEAWRTFEHAGYSAELLEGSRCGVFVGCREGDYLRPFAHLGTSSHQGTGNSGAMLASRIAYFLDLKGPSLAIDTACSSSLVALHLACESIRSGTSDLALAGGVSLLTTAESHRILGKSGMLAPDGRCKTFDDAADGFVPAEAVAAVLLKPLDQALRDGDRIFGVILAHGINQDGKTNGITASSAPSQTALQQETYRRFGIDPDTIGYVEAHGTGTSLGDPIEIDALTETFRAHTQRKQFCAVGSVKTNIGHALAAAGIAGLIKALLALGHRQLPPSLHFRKENRHFHLAETPFHVNTELRDWEAPAGAPRRAAVSAFGFSGTNAHCVVEEAPDAPADAAGREDPGPYLIPLSAKTPADLAARVRALADWLEDEGEAFPLGDIAATLLLGRSHFDFRAALVASDRQALPAELRALAARPETEWKKIDPEPERGAALRQFGNRLLAELRDPGLPEAERGESLRSLADLYRRGYALDWRLLVQDAATPPAAFRKVPLPTYPFLGARYWLAPAAAAPAMATPVPAAFPPEPPELRAFQEAYARLPEFCGLLLAGALREMGAFRTPGERYSPEGLRAALGIDARYHRLLDAFLKLLQDAGHLRREGRDFVCAEGEAWRLPFDELERRKDRLAEEFPGITAFLNLLWVCVRSYPEVLRGRIKATEVMFPGSSLDLVKGIYRENATADFYNRILVDNVIAAVEARIAEAPGAGPLQILEIGAGTGGTSAPLLARLQRFGERIGYLYTDVSSGFVQYGRRTYGPRHAFARFEVLDIENPVPPDCGFRKSFDLVVAANVLHATRNLDRTLCNVEALLKDGGGLFLNEATDVQAFATMTYGLLEGWWLFEDGLRLAHSPLLDADRWVALLARRGFAVAPPQGLTGDKKGPGQHILMARWGGGGPPLARAPAPAAPRPQPAAPEPAPVPLRQRIAQEVTAAVCHILGLEDPALATEKQFSDYGLDSISGIDFLNRVNKRLGIELRATALFDYPSVAELSAFIHDTWGARLEAGACDEESAESPPPTSGPAAGSGLRAEAAPAPMAPAAPWETRPDDIAIIGMSGRFSGTRDVHEFWDKLAAGVSTLGAPPASRWPEGGFPEGYRAGFLEDIAGFDPMFFNWSGSEAEQADPQQRLFLEESYAALEDAGYPPARLNALNCGVFAGAGMSDYLMNMRESGYACEAQSFWGNSPAVVPARISYFLNLKGPAVAVDTACSASLVAMHWARHSLLSGECDLALAGGVFLCTTPHFHTLATTAKMLAPDGRCKAFDASADGFVFGEGVGVLVLKRLDAALRDQDHIHGVLKASGINQDGRTNGITAPSSLSQTELEAAVYEQAGINPETIGYVEAHGTGTRLGDPVEVEALSNAFGRYTDRKRFCLLGSVKPNIGHASLAAGVAGVIKVLQCFAHGKIPPLLNFSGANPHIDFADSPFRINTELLDWERSGNRPRRAAVSGFGLSGTNAHLVLEEAPVRPDPRPDWEEVPVLICLSAKTEASLRQKIRDLAAYLEGRGRRYSLGHIAYTLHVGREHHTRRIALVAENRGDLLRQLRDTGPEILPETGPAPAGDVELWMAQLRTAGLPLPEALERLHALAALYREGRDDIDWRNLYASDARRRVPLPTYPYDRSRFWFPVPNAAARPAEPPRPAPVRSETAATAEDEDDRTFWEPRWEPAPPGPSRGDDRGPLLLFGDGHEDLSCWSGAPVVLATAGEDFSLAPPVSGAALAVRLRPGNSSDYEQLANLLASRGLLPARVLHGWTLNRPFSPDQAEAHLDLGFYSLLFLAQALMKRRDCPERVRLIHAFLPSAARDHALNQALGGFARTLNLEHPAFFCQTLEVPDAADLAGIAAGEFRRAAAHEVEVRYRRGAGGALSREVKAWRPAALDPAFAAPLALKERGTYLLTGGAGGLGLLFCRYLAAQAERQKTRIRVHPTGRRALSAGQARALASLGSPWCEVEYLRGDIADAREARRVVDRARGPLGGITGVFHFAGITRDAFLLKKTQAECREVLAPKIPGMLQLERALQGEKVDFVALFSSASAALGNVGQADYAYANAFLDACAAQGGIAGSHTFSVNWALWRDGGMQLADGKRETMSTRMGVRVLAGDAGLGAFETILHSGRKQGMFLSGDGRKIGRFVEARFAPREPAPGLVPAGSVDIGRLLREAETVGRLKDGEATAGAPAASMAAVPTPIPTGARQEIESFLKKAVAEVSRLPADKLAVDRPLEEFGLDSLMITALNDRLMARFGPLPATLFFEYPTLSALAGHLAGRQGVTRTAPPPEAPAADRPVEDGPPSAVAPIYRKAEAIGLDTGAPRNTAILRETPAEAGLAGDLRRETEAFLKNSVAEVSRLAPEACSLNRPLEEFGLDSLMIAALNEKLAARFGPLPATLFFEYSTLSALAAALAARAGSGPAVRPATADGGRCEAGAVAGENRPGERAAAGLPRQDGHPCATAKPDDSIQVPARAGAHPWSAGAPLDIAIIGVSGLYPGAATLDAFWENLKAGRDSVTGIPRSRWNADDYFDPDRARAMQGKMYCRWGGFIDDVDRFDAAFFNISPREAKLMDPSERLFLQTAWAAFEDAGYTRGKLAETCAMNVGVFAGISSYAYSLYGPDEWAKGNWYTPCGGLWSIANRVSYVMNLNGPSCPVDTACSSSLSAVHQACRSLRDGECAMAVAGGAAFLLHPQQYIGMCQNQMLSPTGRCHSFGAEGDGFVPGEGVGAVVLKPLARALADRDPILAVIKGSAVNHGGRTNGYAVPNPKAQAELIRRALADAGIDPGSITYVEAHGTGTALGDPVEFEGLCQAWAAAAGGVPAVQQWCALGSVKSNIGHLGAAAGISGLTKILLQMRHGTLAPSLHARNLNPKIDFANSPFRLQREPAPWEPRRAGQPRRAAISSFGAGGANAHLILEDYPDPLAAGAAPGPEPKAEYLVPLSARDPEGLLAYAEKMLMFWERHRDSLRLKDFAYTLQTGREAMAQRFAFIAAGKEDVVAQLRAFLESRRAEHGESAVPPGCFQGRAGEYAEAVDPGRLAGLAAAGAYADLARLWVGGAEVHWESLPCWKSSGRDPARRVSLPTYPFAGKPYWYPERPAAAAEAAAETGDPLARYRDGFRDLARFGSLGLLKVFQAMGCFREAGEAYGRDELKARIGLIDDYGRLYHALLDILRTAGHVEIEGDLIRATASAAAEEEPQAPDYWSGKHPELAESFRLLSHCLANLAAVLKGRIPATEVLFPGGSMVRVEKLYRENAVADHYNRLVAGEVLAFVREALPRLPEGRKLRLLEIGAGTGGTSAAVLEALEPCRDRLHYDYTDISPSFLQHGRKRFGPHGGIDFRVLDIERSPERQGFALGQADLVIAANVLHATRNLNATLRNVKSLLRQGGRLVINEAVEPHVFSTLTFGLLKGWWLADDPHNRLPGSPLLSVPLWERILAAEGYLSVRAAAPRIEAGAGQNVLVAESDGRIVAPEAPPVPAARETVPEPESLPADGEARKNGLVKTLGRIVARVIEVAPEEIGPDTAYVDLGVDSILAVEIIDQANRELGIDLRSTALFDHATVNRLAAHILARHGDAIVGEDPLLEVFRRLHRGELDIRTAGTLLDARQPGA